MLQIEQNYLLTTTYVRIFVDMVQVLIAGQLMLILLKLHVGSTVLAPSMDGVMLGPSRSQQLAGLQLFPYLNPIGKFAWLVDFQQALAYLLPICQLYFELISSSCSILYSLHLCSVYYIIHHYLPITLIEI